MDGQGICPPSSLNFSNSMRWKVFQVNFPLMLNAFFVVVMVGMRIYGRRYRHLRSTRFIYVGAILLFVPIMTNVVSGVGYDYATVLFSNGIAIVADCHSEDHMKQVILWTVLIQIAAINTSAIVARVEREGRNVGPRVGLLLQAIWTFYLAVYNSGKDEESSTEFKMETLVWRWVHSSLLYISLLPFVIILAKMTLKFYAFHMIRKSFAFGRNPHLIVRYMEHLKDGISQHNEHVPPLLVMGEESLQVEKRPDGYSFTWMSEQGGIIGMNNNRLVTIDKVWQSKDMLLESTPRLKDVCLSFTLFKLLRCRFARYTIDEAGSQKVFHFFWHVLLNHSDERVLGVIEDELSFLYDYYYTSIPISYYRWLSILSIFTSLLSMGWCLFFVVALVRTAWKLLFHQDDRYQFSCNVTCIAPNHRDIYGGGAFHHYGSLYFVLVPVCLLAVLVVLTEVRQIISYILSNWTKVHLICRYVDHASWLQSPTMQKWVGSVLRCDYKLLKHWEDKMSQCSILVLHPRKRHGLFFGVSFLFLRKRWSVKIPKAVKTAVMDKLRSNSAMASLSRSLELQVGEDLRWTFSGAKGIAHSVLVCHIATSILEVRSRPRQSLSDAKIAATHLSRYCAYLVAHTPELLPDDDKWCKSLYKAVKEDVKRVLAGGTGASTPEVAYQELVEMMIAESEHEVLKDGAELGKRLVDLREGEETAWKVLTGFWSEMIMYVAPSDNMKGHAEAIARGGELARRSFSLGRNPRLIVGYMQQLLEGSQHGEPPRGEDLPPPLVVMGEDRRQVEKQHHGYVFSKNLEATDQEALVTIDRVWKLVDRLPMPMPQLKEICFSFALFKLLRCRFARFKLIGVISTETLNFFRSVLLKDGEHERAFRMIVDELSFLHDYYDSPLPMSYSDWLLPILSMVISLLTIGYCILSGIDIAVVYKGLRRSTIFCGFDCNYKGSFSRDPGQYGFGSLHFDLVPVLFVVIAEARDIASHICSDRTKVTFTCQCVHRDFLKLSPVVPKWVGLLLQSRPKFMRHWNDKMRQNSMLALRKRKVQLVFPGCLLRLLYQGRNVKIPTEVKACIINALRSSSNGGLRKGRTSLRQNQVGESLLQACDSEGTSDVILIWHIATCILEDRHPDQHDLHGGSSIADHKTTASHLSRYCAYLVACYPELLPDDDTWSKSLYKAVEKDAVRVLAGGIAVSTSEDYEQMVDLLIKGSKHEVLKKGAELGKQLVEMVERGEEMAWKVLADFWSEMILYVAPSDNIKGHAEAIDRGGELITLLWALLTHIGIVDRPDNTTTASTPSVV